jgi:PAT family acetyl-CoA transporter-like MFS transporter 1
LKLTEAGVTKEIQTLMDLPLTVVSIVWAMSFSKFANAKNKSLVLNLWTILIKIGMSLITALFLYFIYALKDSENNFYWWFYLIYFINGALTSIIDTTLFIANVSFMASVADKNVGATYMTLLATLSNLGN